MSDNQKSNNKQTSDTLNLSSLQQEIINNFQKDFPLCEQPYQTVARLLDSTEEQVLGAIKELDQQGVLSRIGPVFDHKKAGASTLAAIAAPPEQLDKIAGIVNQFDQVNHNYAREHDYNLWFVVTASDPIALAETLHEIECLTGLSILVLPMEASYHIDLGFKINFSANDKDPIATENLNTNTDTNVNSADKEKCSTSILNDHTHSSQTNKSSEQLIPVEDNAELKRSQQSQLRGLIEKGLPNVFKPFAELAQSLNVTSSQVISQISMWQKEGLIRRFGLVVKHRKLGFNANAMVVWNIPDKFVDVIAGQLSKFDEVSLCYRRPRRLPGWPYNLFCMIHGTDRDVVLAQIAKITQQLVSNNKHIWRTQNNLEQDILFSTKAYKQHGARYSKADPKIVGSGNTSVTPLANTSNTGSDHKERAHG
jgi:DNA-binding Lrp family transcriptional regulator